MITNILATIVVIVTTNTHAPKQHLVTHFYSTYPVQVEEVWKDGPASVPESIFHLQSQERDNPDIRITEVHEITTLQSQFGDIQFTVQLSDVILSTFKQRREATTEEKWIDIP